MERKCKDCSSYVPETYLPLYKRVCLQGSFPCLYNGTHPEFVPMTNGDRIRRMNDDELEIFLRDLIYERNPGICVQYKSGYECDQRDQNCQECPKLLKNWLQAPHTQTGGRL